MNEELKPCPFCGGRAELIDTTDGEFYVECRKCGISTRAYVRPETSKRRWDRRVNDD